MALHRYSTRLSVLSATEFVPGGSTQNRIPAVPDRRVSSPVPTVIVALDVSTNAILSSAIGPLHQKEGRNTRRTQATPSSSPMDQFKIQLLARRTIRTGQVQREEFHIRDSNGGMRIFESESGLLLDDHQRVSTIVVTTRDITEQRHTQESLQRRERQFRLVMGQSSEIIALVDKRARLLATGPSTKAALGYDEDDILGRDVLLLIHPEDRRCVRRYLRDLATRPGSTIGFRHRFKHKNGSWRFVEGVGTNLLNDPTVHAIVLNYQDATGDLFGTTAIARDTATHKENEALNFELKTPPGMLPMCSWCKRVRDDKGDWSSIESYLESRMRVQFTHGICPDCIERRHRQSNTGITNVEGL